MTAYWLSTHRMTIRVDVDDTGRVVDAAPVARWAVGRTLLTLEQWLKKQGGFIKTELERVE